MNLCCKGEASLLNIKINDLCIDGLHEAAAYAYAFASILLICCCFHSVGDTPSIFLKSREK